MGLLARSAVVIWHNEEEAMKAAHERGPTLLLCLAHFFHSVEIFLRVTSNLRSGAGRDKVFDPLPVLPNELQT